MTFVNSKNTAAAIALASALGFNAFSAMAESKPATQPAAKAAAPAAAPAAAATAKPAAEAPAEVVAEPTAAPEAATEAAPEAAAAPATAAPAPAAEAQPEAAPAAPAPAKAVEAPAPAKAADAPAKAASTATGSAAHQVSLGSVVVGADGKEVGTVNRVRTEASGNVTEIHVQSKTGVVSVPGNKIASGGQNVKLSLTADEVSKLPAVGGGRS